MIGLAIALALAGAQTPARLPPVERCRGDQGFDQFRRALEDAVTRKDAAALRRVTATDMRVNFGGDSGWNDFAREWGLGGNASASSLWTEMQRVIKLGCATTPDGMGRVFPGLFEDLGDDADPYETIVARGGAPLFDRPGGRVVATLDWNSARMLETEAPEEWAQVELADGTKGWMRHDDWLSPIGYRLVAEKRGGRWVMAAFLAGD